MIYNKVIMLYQLTNGKVVELSVEDYLDMSDADLQNLVGYNHGEFTNNPWLHSALGKEQIVDEEEESLIRELDDVSDLEKLLDLDLPEEE